MRHNHSFLYTRVHKDLKKIPKDVKTLIFGMFIYVLAWGIIDPFFSIFVNNIVQNYFITGLFFGMFFIVGAIVALPGGALADKINKIKFTVFSLFLYPILGLLYFSVPFLSSAAGLVVLFVSRLFHGVIGIFWVVEESFIREKSPKSETSATFGLYITAYRSCFVIAPLFVIPIVLFFGLNLGNLQWLLLALIPFPILGALIISRIKYTKGEPFVKAVKEVIVQEQVVKKEFKDLKDLGFIGYFTLLIGFFMMSIQVIVVFLIPLHAVSLNLGLIEISLLFALINLPFLFSFFFAEIADSLGKVNVIGVGFVIASIALAVIALDNSLSFVFFAAAFVLGIIVAIIQPAVNGLITDITPRVNDGEMTGLFMATLRISGFISVLLLGFLAESYGLHFPFMVFAFLILAMAGVTFLIKSKVVIKI